jgi:hypothetical protein
MRKVVWLRSEDGNEASTIVAPVDWLSYVEGVCGVLCQLRGVLRLDVGLTWRMCVMLKPVDRVLLRL